MNFQRWATLWQRLDLAGDPTPTWHALTRAYAEPARAYHTLAHIQACLAWLDEVHALAVQPDAVEMALWLHDVVYDPRRKDNEAQSAQWAAARLAKAGATAAFGNRVQALILATQHHLPPPLTDADAILVVDIDLAILGQPATAYDVYETQIRQEYAWVPGPLFRAGRAQVLKSFLARPTIFHTPLFAQRFETVARANLQRALERL